MAGNYGLLGQSWKGLARNRVHNRHQGAHVRDCVQKLPQVFDVILNGGGSGVGFFKARFKKCANTSVMNTRRLPVRTSHCLLNGREVIVVS